MPSLSPVSSAASPGAANARKSSPSTVIASVNWMRYWFCGWERGDFEKRTDRFLETRQRVSLQVYDTVFARFAEHLAAGGIAAVHLGCSRKCDMAAELSAIAARHLEVVAVLDEDVTHCEKHGLRDKGAVTAHQYLVLRRRA